MTPSMRHLMQLPVWMPIHGPASMAYMTLCNEPNARMSLKYVLHRCLYFYRYQLVQTLWQVWDS